MKRIIALTLCLVFGASVALAQTPNMPIGPGNGSTGSGGGGPGTMGQVTISTTGGGVNTGTCSSSTSINCTIGTQVTPTTLSGSNPPITAPYSGGLENLSNGSNQIPTIAEAGTTGFPIGWETDLCNVGAGTQTLTPGSPGTVGGASTYVLAAGSAATPKCIRIVSDGVSNYDVVFPPASGSTSFANPSATAGPAANNGSATTAMRSDASPAVQVGSATQEGILQVDNASIVASAGTINVNLANNFAWSGDHSFAGAGAASTASVIGTGTVFTGGNGTTTFPNWYINQGSGPTTFSTSGTEFGINAPTGFAGNFQDFHLNGGASVFLVSSVGAITMGGQLTIGPSQSVRSVSGPTNLISIAVASGATPAGAVNLLPGASSSAVAGSNAGAINLTAGAQTAATGTNAGGSVSITGGASTAGVGGGITLTPGVGAGSVSAAVTIAGLPTANGSYLCISSGVLSIEAAACPVSNMDAKNVIAYLEPQTAADGLDTLPSPIYTLKDWSPYGAHNKEHVGLSAQDVEKMDPRCVTRDDKKHKLQNYDPNCMISYLIAARKADKALFQSEIESLRRRIH